MLQEEFQRNIDQLMNIIGQKPDNRAVLCSLLVALLFSGVMILTYRLVNQIHSYDAKFAVTLLTLALISTILMDLIQSNLALGQISMIPETSALFSGPWPLALPLPPAAMSLA